MVVPPIVSDSIFTNLHFSSARLTRALSSTMNIKHSIFVLLAVALPAFGIWGEAENAKPDSIESWLEIIELPEFKTLSAVDVNGHYFAVKINASGGILVASHKHGDSKRFSHGHTTLVESTEGENLFSGKFDVAANAHYTVHHKINGVKARSKIACPRGIAYSLKDHRETMIRVRYLVDRKKQKNVEILNQLVALPKIAG